MGEQLGDHRCTVYTPQAFGALASETLLGSMTHQFVEAFDNQTALKLTLNASNLLNTKLNTDILS